MTPEYTPIMPPVEQGKVGLESLYKQFATKFVSPLISAQCAKIKLSVGSDLHRLFFLNDGLTYCGRNTLKLVYAKTLEDIVRRFPNTEDMSELMNNNAALEILDLLISSYLLSIANQELERERSGYDSLMKGFVQKNNTSGLYQRVIEGILYRAKTNNTPVSMVFCDLDLFKGVNDYGQHVGDVTLTHLANVITSNLRGQTTCIRWGGEEIVLLLEDCTPDKACEAALRINEALNRSPLHLIADVKDLERQEVASIYALDAQRYLELEMNVIERKQRRALESTIFDPRSTFTEEKKVRLLKIPLSASIGVVAVNLNNSSPIDAAFVEANALERAAKQNGRNQVWHYDQGNMKKFKSGFDAE